MCFVTLNLEFILLIFSVKILFNSTQVFIVRYVNSKENLENFLVWSPWKIILTKPIDLTFVSFALARSLFYCFNKKCIDGVILKPTKMMSIQIVCFVKKKGFMIMMLFTNIIELNIISAISAKKWGKKSKIKKLAKWNSKFSMIQK